MHSSLYTQKHTPGCVEIQRGCSFLRLKKKKEKKKVLEVPNFYSLKDKSWDM
jgi:hypothetical protein